MNFCFSISKQENPGIALQREEHTEQSGTGMDQEKSLSVQDEAGELKEEAQVLQ